MSVFDWVVFGATFILGPAAAVVIAIREFSSDHSASSEVSKT